MALVEGQEVGAAHQPPPVQQVQALDHCNMLSNLVAACMLQTANQSRRGKQCALQISYRLLNQCGSRQCQSLSIQ